MPASSRRRAISLLGRRFPLQRDRNARIDVILLILGIMSSSRRGRDGYSVYGNAHWQERRDFRSIND